MIHTDLIVSTRSFFSQPPSLPHFCLNPGKVRDYFFSGYQVFPYPLLCVSQLIVSFSITSRAALVLTGLVSALHLSANSSEPEHTFNAKCRRGADYQLLKYPADRVSESGSNLTKVLEGGGLFFPSIPLVIRIKGSIRRLLEPLDEPHYLKWVMTQSSGIREPCKVADWAGRGDGRLNKCTH